MAINWTKSQEDAIKHTKSSLLVSASAGSGKTTVMVEKILRYLQEGHDITRLVVITFTEASATDLKDSISRKLADVIRVSAPNSKETEHLKKQLDNLPFSYIGTIDSFCATIYKKYFEKIGVDPTYLILEESEEKAMKNQAFNSVLEEYLDSGDVVFKELAEKLKSGRSYEKMSKLVIDMLGFLAVQENPDAFLDKVINATNTKFGEDAVHDYLIAYFKKLAKKSKAKLMHAFQVSKELGENKFEQVRVDMFNALEGIEKASTLVEIGIIARENANIKNGAFKGKDVHKEATQLTASAYAIYEKLVSTLEKVLQDVDTLEERENSARVLSAKFAEFLSAVKKRYEGEKAHENRADFSDIEHCALKIVSIAEIAQEIADSIDHIYIDEYQDTNRLQEAIFAKIERKNMFLVGDIKQSIYGFRFAEPTIFSSKLDKFAENSEEGANIPFNENFRTETKVVKFINAVFNSLMTKDFGGVNYAKDAQLVPDTSITADDNVPPVEVVVFADEQAEQVEYPEVYSVKDAVLKTQSRSQEGIYIANRIKDVVGKFKIYDRKLDGIDKMRPIRYSDIAVLVRKRKNAAPIIKEFDRMDVPYTAASFDGDFDMTDVDAITAFLRVIDNHKNDMPLIKSLLTNIGNLSEDELLIIRQENPEEKYFYQAVEKCTHPLIRVKLDEYFEKVERYRKLAKAVDVAELFTSIAVELGVDAVAISDREEGRIESFNAYVSFLRGKEFAKDVASYLAYRDANTELTIKRPSAGSNAVRFITIHGSKGLEFPIVFVAGLGERPKGGNAYGNGASIDEEFGLGMDSFEDENQKSSTSLTTFATKIKKERKELEEEVRMLYVAFTRAKSHLILTGKESKERKEAFEDTDVAMQWLQMIGEKNAVVRDAIKQVSEVTELDVDVELKEYHARLLDGQTSLAFKYAHKEATTLSNKYSVTALNEAHDNIAEESTKTTVIVNENERSSTHSPEMGTLYHAIMENIDFNLTQKEEIERAIDGMIADGILDGEMPIDRSVIVRAIKNPLFDVARRGACYREQPFIMNLSANEILKNVETADKVLVQGIIDLLVKDEDGEYVLIDYKYTGASEREVRERYSEQIELYTLAIEKTVGKKPVRRAIYVLGRDSIVEF